MHSTLIHSEDEWLFTRHSEIARGIPAILFIHGLGDSSLAFQEAAGISTLRRFNLVAVDLLGHGRSSPSIRNDYSFRVQVKWLEKVLDHFEYERVLVVGHSLGGDIATHLATEKPGRIKGIVNIEGNLTFADVITSRRAVEAASAGDFKSWFIESYMRDTVFENWAKKWDSCKRYYASLWYCDPDAFLTNAMELCKQNEQISIDGETHTGIKFRSLQIPKVYCWGGQVSDSTATYIKNHSTTTWGFEDAFHWPMIDKAEQFYYLLSEFCLKVFEIPVDGFTELN